MPQSLSLNLLHRVFSTKDRMPLLAPAIRPQLHAYLATVARKNDGECYRVGGVADHVHLALRLSRTVCLADLVSGLKTSSAVSQACGLGWYGMGRWPGRKMGYESPCRWVQSMESATTHER